MQNYEQPESSPRKIILENPFVDFYTTKENFSEYIELYNADKPLGKRIRRQHIELFYDVVRLYKRNISQNTFKYKDTNPELVPINIFNPPNLSTNNIELSRRLHVDPSTIYRQIQRLIETKIIVDKTNHGSQKNYELTLNPALVAIFDYNTPNALMPDAKTAFFSDRIAICNPDTVSSLATYNNIIIANKGLFHKKSSQDTINRNNNKELLRNNISQDTKQETTTGNTGNLAKQSNEEHIYGAKIQEKEEKIKKLRRQFAAWLVALMMDALMIGRNVYPGEVNRTVNYVSETYFSQCITYEGVDKMMDEYRKRIEIAKNYKTTHPGYEAPFPYDYFDINNRKNGFSLTKKWLIQQQKWLKIKKIKKYQSDQNKLLTAIRKVNENPDIMTLNTQKAYVKTNISHLLPVFDKMVQQIKFQNL